MRSRLDGLLDIQRHREQLIYIELAAAQRQVENELGRVDLLNQAVAAQAISLTQQQQGQVQVLLVQASFDYLEALKQGIVRQQDRVAAARQRVDGVRQRLQHATMQRKAVEKVQDRHHVLVRYEAQRKETAELDEASGRRYQNQQ